MYFQPYGDDQQLNLNWIINEIINLHKQLDPNYETPSFTQVYPYSNLNRLNLDWVLSELKALKELAPEPTPTFDIQAVAEALVALPFDSNTSYQIYDFISKDGEIWRATETIAAGGVWDETKWFKTKIGTDLAVLERWINAINNSLTSLQNTVANLSSIDISDDSDAGGATVKASLNNLKSAVDTLDSDVDNLTSADISDDSDAGGATVKASLNNLKGSLNANESAIAIVADGNTHPAIALGQYVYVKNNNTLTEGLYKATAAIPLNGTISTTNVSNVSNGGLNDASFPIELQRQEITNTYFDLTLAYNSIECFKVGSIYVFKIRIAPSAEIPAGTTDFAIATFNISPAMRLNSNYVIAPSQYGEQYAPLTLQINSSGTIVVANNHQTKAAQGFYVANFVLL